MGGAVTEPGLGFVRGYAKGGDPLFADRFGAVGSFDDDTGPDTSGWRAPTFAGIGLIDQQRMADNRRVPAVRDLGQLEPAAVEPETVASRFPMAGENPARAGIADAMPE